MVSYDTPMEAIEQLRLKIIAYMNANSREWSDCALNIDKMQYQNAIYLNVSMERESFFTTVICFYMINIRCRPTKLAGLGRSLDSKDSIHAKLENHTGAT